MPRLSKIGAAALAAFGWTGLSSVTASYLVVAGGGGAGGVSNDASGGGGAGGLLTGTTSLNPTQSYTVTVGAGGTGGAGGAANNGTSGSNSVFNTITTTGGGYGGGGSGGGAVSNNGASGGSGGGASNNPSTGGAGNTPSTSPSQGSNGGAPYGGGGGASGAGTATAFNGANNGGAGTASSISGTSVNYAGGGCSGGSQGNTFGGGNGETGPGNANNTAGTANTGGGGGGAWNSGSRAGAQGGSGVVIISYVGAQQFGGGVVTSSGGNTIHTFTTSGTLSPLSSLTASYLIVAGGGGAGATHGGGGGAGGLLSGSGVTIDTNSTYLVTVGAGGTGAVVSVPYNNGTNGSNSAFSMVTTTAVGGGKGGGGASDGTPASGGSGGGGGNGTGGGTGGAGTVGQGNNGGGGVNTGVEGAGGGGGAGAVGANGTTGGGGNGGAGSSSSISGTATFYAGGGGGGSVGGTQGTGGSGGGGNGATSGAGSSGTANRGGGGGGGASGGAGGAGGSGIVIISYAGATQLMAGGTVTISGGNVIHTFNSSGYLTPLKLVGNSLRFRSSASANLTRTPTVSGNMKTWTWSAWVKRGSLSQAGTIWGSNFSAGGFGLAFGNYGGPGVNPEYIGITLYAVGTVTTSAVFRDPAAWYHIVARFDSTQATQADRFRLYINGVQQTLSGALNVTLNADYHINEAGRLHVIGGEATYYNDFYLAEINHIDGQSLTPFSFGTFNSYGVWQPITYGGSYGTNGFYLPFNTNASATVQFTTNSASNYSNFGGTAWQFTGDFTIETYVNYQSASSGDNSAYIVSNGTTYLGFNVDKSANLINVYLNGTTPAFTAPFTVSANAWAHLALVRSGSTVTMYVNGVARGSTTNSGTLGYSSPTINRNGGGASAQRVMSNLRICKSAVYAANFTPSTTALTTTSQGATNCELLTLQSNPPVDASTNAYAVTTSGTPLYATDYPFAWNIFNDQSPQGNNWTPNNISGYPDSTLDYMTDVPTLTSTTAANYATLSPLQKNPNITPTNGNLRLVANNASWRAVGSTIFMITGKWYCEMTVTTIGDTAFGLYSLADGVGSVIWTDNNFAGRTGTTGGSYLNSGNKISGGSSSAYGASFTTGDVIACAYDADAGTVVFYKNNTSQGTAFTGFTGGYAFTLAVETGAGTTDLAINFGQQPYVYTAPANHLALNTFNL